MGNSFMKRGKSAPEAKRDNEGHTSFRSIMGRTNLNRSASVSIGKTTAILLYKTEDRPSFKDEDQITKNFAKAREIIDKTMSAISNDPNKISEPVKAMLKTHFNIDPENIDKKSLDSVYNNFENISKGMYSRIIEAKITENPGQPSNSRQLDPPHLAIAGRAENASDKKQPGDVAVMRLAKSTAIDPEAGPDAIIALVAINKASLQIKEGNDLKIRHTWNGTQVDMDDDKILLDSSAYVSFSKDLCRHLEKELSNSRDDHGTDKNDKVASKTYEEGLAEGMNRAQHFTDALFAPPPYQDFSSSSSDSTGGGGPVIEKDKTPETHEKDPDHIVELKLSMDAALQKLKQDEDIMSREDFVDAILHDINKSRQAGGDEVLNQNQTEEFTKALHELHDVVGKKHEENFKEISNHIVNVSYRPREYGFSI